MPAGSTKSVRTLRGFGGPSEGEYGMYRRGTPSMGNEGARVARELDLEMGPKGYKNRCSILKSAAGLISKTQSCSTTSGRGPPLNHCNFSCVGSQRQIAHQRACSFSAL